MIHGTFSQGTTPQIQFNLPVPIEEIAGIKVSFSQKKKVILVKEFDEFSFDSEANSVSVSLSQEETFLFKEQNGLITVKLRILFADNTAVAANEVFLMVEDTYDKEVVM